jgi:hypothetical protein
MEDCLEKLEAVIASIEIDLLFYEITGDEQRKRRWTDQLLYMKAMHQIGKKLLARESIPDEQLQNLMAFGMGAGATQEEIASLECAVFQSQNRLN